MQAAADYQEFFSQKGVEQRNQRVKFRVMQQNTEVEDEKTAFFNMLKLHNTKVAKVIKGFQNYQELREKSKAEGIPFEQLLKESKESQESNMKEAKETKKAKKVKKLVNEPTFEIVVKVDG